MKAFVDEFNIITIHSNLKPPFYINGVLLNTSLISDNLYSCSYCLDYGKDYLITNSNNESTFLEYRYVTKTKEFDDLFYYDNDDLGYIYNPLFTTFKIWAPIASKVNLIINNKSYKLERKEYGVFEIVIHGDLLNFEYYYEVTNNRVTNKVLDPYGYTLIDNGRCNVVIDYSKIKVNRYLKNEKDNIIYELSIRDFSSLLDIEDKGKYGALKIENLTNRNNDIVGIDYIKRLGVTTIQLMPILDFVTVDENNQFNSYNWGYDPLLFSSFEGSYSKKPKDGNSRINEVVNMINYLHKNNLRVSLDIVFNHTYYFEKSNYYYQVPYYFYMVNSNGELSNGSYCGNDFDSTLKMSSKYLFDMAKRLIKIYKIDGIRFDLMGILNYNLINKINKFAKSYNNNFILYGEGWNMPSMLDNNLKASLDNSYKMDDVSFFNDKFRECVFSYLTGNLSAANDFVNALKGSVGGHYYFSNALKSINYVECHDNYTLSDRIDLMCKKIDINKKKNMIKSILASIVFSLGISFISMGEEFLRSKKGHDNSYNLDDSINGIDWNLISDNKDVVEALIDFISIKKKYRCFNIHDSESINGKIDNVIIDDVNIITYLHDGVVKLAFNPNNDKKEIELNGDYYLIATQNKKEEIKKLYNKISIDPYGFVLLKK